MKVAIVHYWLVSMRGGEKVVEALCRMYPDADVYTHVYDPDGISETIRRHRVTTTFISRLPGARRKYQRYLPLMPLALEQLDLRGYDLVISSESGPAKGVLVGPHATHVCYCHTPMRYVWDLTWDYLAHLNPVVRPVARLILHYLRLWDHASAQRVDAFAANSKTVGARVRRWYGRDARIVHPPVDVTPPPPPRATDDAYLIVGQLVRYKRVDLAIEACNRLGRRLRIIGEGEERAALERIAGPTIEFLGWQPTSVVREAQASCRALLFPGEEDFGIVPVEVMAAGRPVIAFGRGGASETVTDGVTGVLFHAQTVDALQAAIQRLEAEPERFDAPAIAARMQEFSEDRFMREMRALIDETIARRATAGGKA